MVKTKQSIMQPMFTAVLIRVCSLSMAKWFTNFTVSLFISKSIASFFFGYEIILSFQITLQKKEEIF